MTDGGVGAGRVEEPLAGGDGPDVRVVVREHLVVALGRDLGRGGIGDADGPDEVIPSLKDALGALGIPSILGCVEMTSTLQQSRQENEVIRLQWSADADEGKSVGAMSKTYAGCDDAISLSPLDIRTFTFSVP